ncbi:MAG: aminotransferase class I/II-fold pyridoxal phosphate-dependent enzyme [Desulfobacteraceae bacterium]|nr:MAG: aminotransferase class I/II-fold pyridoxal phosphate-dependent enzyme [Desulfobacteraceae bacterium]
MNIPSKLPDTGITIFTQMTRLAQENGAINLSQGFPDFNTDPKLIELVGHHMRIGHNQYAPMQGVPVLRERIAEKIKELYHADCNPETFITITSGATEALFCAISTIVHHHDEIIIFEPAFDSYLPAVRLHGGIPVFVKLQYPDYTIDWDEVRKKISPRTKAIILNSPHNPTGTVIGSQDIIQLQKIIQNHDLLIISDEVYEHIIFDQIPHEGILRYPDLAARSFVISSFGKTYHTTGWKIGYCVAPPPLTDEFRKIHQYVTFASNTPIQYAYAEIMEEKDYYHKLAVFYQHKRDLFQSLLQDSRFTTLPCRGTYFQMMEYSKISTEPDTVFAGRLTTEYGVAAIPPSVFYHTKDDHKVLRFCFAKTDDTLKKAAEILCRI